jgi:acyl-CoA synthetase (AMP-forming)/AMP-acid ligase II
MSRLSTARHRVETRHVTYSELAVQADAVAAMLRRSSCAPGEVIAVWSGPVELVTVMLGVFQAGCILCR